MVVLGVELIVNTGTVYRIKKVLKIKGPDVLHHAGIEVIPVHIFMIWSTSQATGSN